MSERRNDDHCGICDHPKQGHGIRYAAVVGEHNWAPGVSWLRADDPGTLNASIILDRLGEQLGRQ